VPGLAARFFVRITCPLIVVRRYPDECMAIPVIIDLYNIYMYVMYIYIHTHTHTHIYMPGMGSPTTKSVGYPNDGVRSSECTDTSLFRLDDLV